MNIKVSVIIPTHNRAHLLKRAIESVRAQTLQNLEVIVVNDASTDETLTVLQNFAKQDDRIKFISNNDPQGGSKSRNIGIHASRGEWIAFLDDDDLWAPQKLELQLNHLLSYPNAVACSSGYCIHYPFKITKTILTPSKISLAKLLMSNALGGASVCLCSARVLKQIGGFDEKLRSAQDWDLWVRLRMIGDIISINLPLVQYQIHFSYRISNDMRAKYAGSRAFFLKYKELMCNKAKQMNLCFICFIQSRQQHNPIAFRMKKLWIAVRRSSPRVGFAYFISSFPRLVIGMFSKNN